MSVTSVRAQVVRFNEVSYHDCPQTIDIPCASARVIDLAWMVPITNGGVLTGYEKNLDTAKPTPDSVRMLNIKTDEDNYWVVINDDDDESAFVDKCNECCGDTPEMDAVTIPALILEDMVCPDVDTTTPSYKHLFNLPTNPSLKLTVSGSFNGEPATPAYNGAGFANAAALLAWVQANWGDAGTWTLVNTNKTLQLVSETTITAGIDITLVTQSYCFVYPEVDTPVDGIMIGANLVTFPQINVNSSSPGALANTLSNYLVGTIVVLDADNVDSPTKLQYTGLQVPVELYLAGDAVDDTSFTVGACTHVFDFAIPAQGNANNYLGISGTFNAVAGSPSPNAAGYATPALLLAFANGSWSAYGVWTLEDSDTTLRLTAATGVTTAVVTVTELAALYCMTVKAGPYNADGIMVDGVQVLFGTPVTAITNISYAGLITAIAAAMPTATVTDAGSAKIQISSKHIPTNLRQSAANVSAQTFALGAC